MRLLIVNLGNYHSSLLLLKLFACSRFTKLESNINFIASPFQFNCLGILVAVDIFNFPSTIRSNIFLPFSYWVFKVNLKGSSDTPQFCLTHSFELWVLIGLKCKHSLHDSLSIPFDDFNLKFLPEGNYSLVSLKLQLCEHFGLQMLKSMIITV